MNAAHLHLLVNHVPLFGIAFGLLLQILGVFRKSRELKLGALCLFVIAALFAVVASQTGDGAALVVRALPGVEKSFIHQHSEKADQAMIATIAAGVLALLSWFLPRWSLKWAKVASGLFLISAVVAAIWMGWTCELGGEVRHTEIRTEAAGAPPPANP